MRTASITSYWRAPAVVAIALAATVPMAIGDAADAAIVATVPLGSAAGYAVLGGSTVTNTGDSVLNGSLGLWPGTSITGFPPGRVNPPGTIDNSNAVAQQAQSDLTAAYGNAAGRPIDATTTADLANLTLQGGVYAGPSKGALSLTGPLTLDGAGNASTVFIFQTNSTLITASGSTVSLINGAQECNVFWQVGSSATLGTGSVFRGNILALTSITVTNGVTVRGRALARNGAVTLDNDLFTRPTCAQTAPATTTTTSGGGTTIPPNATTTTSTGGGGTTTTSAGAGSTSTVPPGGATTTTAMGDTSATTAPSGGTTTTAQASATPGGRPGGPTTTRGSGAPGTPGSPGTPVRVRLPETGAPIDVMVLVALIAITVGTLAVRLDRHHTA